jgi:hypothetical protein
MLPCFSAAPPRAHRPPGSLSCTWPLSSYLHREASKNAVIFKKKRRGGFLSGVVFDRTTDIKFSLKKRCFCTQQHDETEKKRGEGDMRYFEGPAKNKPTDSHAHVPNPRPTHPPAGFCFCLFLFSAFWAFLGKGGFETAIQVLLQKLHWR